MSGPFKSLRRVNHSTLKDLFVSLYDLSPLELDLLLVLIKATKPLTLDEVAHRVERDRTTVFRSLQKLVSSGLCRKEERSLREGGLYHVYAAPDVEEIKNDLEARIRNIQSGLDLVLKRLGKELEAMFESAYRERAEP